MVGQHVFSHGQLRINWPQYVVLDSLYRLVRATFFQYVFCAVICLLSGQRETFLIRDDVHVCGDRNLNYTGRSVIAGYPNFNSPKFC